MAFDLVAHGRGYAGGQDKKLLKPARSYDMESEVGAFVDNLYRNSIFDMFGICKRSNLR